MLCFKRRRRRHELVWQQGKQHCSLLHHNTWPIAHQDVSIHSDEPGLGHWICICTHTALYFCSSTICGRSLLLPAGLLTCVLQLLQKWNADSWPCSRTATTGNKHCIVSQAVWHVPSPLCGRQSNIAKVQLSLAASSHLATRMGSNTCR